MTLVGKLIPVQVGQDPNSPGLQITVTNYGKPDAAS